MLTQVLSQELKPHAWRQSDSKDGLYIALRQMFPTSANKKEDEVKTLTESYHKYKREYVKHLFFNPHDDNLSKYFSVVSQFLFIFSNYTGTRTTGGSVHLL